MSIESAVYALVEEFKTSGRIVIVGASLAGLRSAEALRREGFRGQLTSSGTSRTSRTIGPRSRSRCW